MAEKRAPGATLRIDHGKVVYETPGDLEGYVSKGVLRIRTTDDGRVVVPNRDVGRHSIPNGIDRSQGS